MPKARKAPHREGTQLPPSTLLAPSRTQSFLPLQEWSKCCHLLRPGAQVLRQATVRVWLAPSREEWRLGRRVADWGTGERMPTLYSPGWGWCQLTWVRDRSRKFFRHWFS